MILTTAMPASCGWLTDVFSKKLVFVWLDMSGSFIYDHTAKKPLPYGNNAIKDIETGLRQLATDDMGLKRYAVIGVIQSRLQPHQHIIWRGELADLTPKKLKTAIAEVKKGLAQAREDLIAKKRGFGHTDVHGTFEYMKTVTDEIESKRKYKRHYAIYYSDMMHTQPRKDPRPDPASEDFKVFSGMRFCAVFEQSAVEQKEGHNALFERSKAFLTEAGARLIVYPPSDMETVAKGESVFMKCIKHKWSD